MKKTTLVLITMIFVSLLSLTACENNDVFSSKEITRNVDDFNKLCINAKDREIEIKECNDEQIHISYKASEKEYLDLASAEKCLQVTLIRNKDFSDYFKLQPKKENRKIIVEIPSRRLSELHVETTNDDITISHVEVDKAIELKSNGGNIKIDTINAGNSIKVETKNGDISGSIIGGWDDYKIDCKVKKGECNLPKKNEGKKELIVNCNNGDVSIDFINT